MAARLAALAAALAALAVPSAAAPQFRGVNLGGWQVLESWIYPKFWAANNLTAGWGEWQVIEAIGADQALPLLQQHWATWVTEEDIAALAAGGVTHVRIPIGYWILGAPFIAPGEPYLAGGWPYLETALGWCAQNGIGAVIDLHGAPGSQNGHDNSGSSGSIGWLDGDNVNRTVAVLAELATRLQALNATGPAQGSIVGIELLNEPWTTSIGGPIPMDTYKAFAQAAADAVLATGWQGDIWVADGWDLSWEGWNGFLSPPKYQSIYFDSHLYHAFGGQFSGMSPWANVNYTCTVDGPALRRATGQDWVIVGEWSLALTNTNPQLPGPNANATTPGVMDAVMWARAFAEAQMQQYGAWGEPSQTPAKGAFFWNFKTEGGGSWSYLDGLKYGFIPAYPPQGQADGGSFDCGGFA